MLHVVNICIFICVEYLFVYDVGAFEIYVERICFPSLWLKDEKPRAKCIRNYKRARCTLTMADSRGYRGGTCKAHRASSWLYCLAKTRLIVLNQRFIFTTTMYYINAHKINVHVMSHSFRIAIDERIFVTNPRKSNEITTLIKVISL